MFFIKKEEYFWKIMPNYEKNENILIMIRQPCDLVLDQKI